MCYPCREVPLNYNRSLPFHGGDTGSTPVRDANNPQLVVLLDFAISYSLRLRRHLNAPAEPMGGDRSRGRDLGNNTNRMGGSHGPSRDDRLAQPLHKKIWNLAFRGCVTRLAEVLKAEPQLAKSVDKDGITPL